MIETIELRTASEVFRYLEPADSRWGQRADLKWVFRGAWDAGWQLLPSAWRPAPDYPPALQAIRDRDDHAIETEIQKLTAEDGDWIRQSELFRHTFSEWTAITEFIRFADELGLDPPTFNDVSQSLALYLARQAFNGIDPYFAAGIDAAGAQHFGIPTRLLDWSLDPLTALFFAVSDSAVATIDSDNLAVWALQIVRFLDPGPDNKEPIAFVYPFRGPNEFLRAQRGGFTLVKDPEEFYIANGRWPTVDDALASSNWPHAEKPQLIKCVIPRSVASELQRILWRRGISKAHLQPTLANAADGIKFKWSAQREKKHKWTLD